MYTYDFGTFSTNVHYVMIGFALIAGLLMFSGGISMAQGAVLAGVLGATGVLIILVLQKVGGPPQNEIATYVHIFAAVEMSLFSCNTLSRGRPPNYVEA